MIAGGLEWGAAWRRLARSPGFSLAVVLLLALGLAAALALAAAASALLLRPLPYAHGERLAEVRSWSGTMGAGLGFAPGLVDALAALPQVEALALWDQRRPLEGESGEPLQVVDVEPSLLHMLGARVLHGRLLQPQDVGSNAIVLSESAWRGRFGADPALIGGDIDFGAHRLQVVGVVADAFRFPQRSTAAWRPLELAADAKTGPRRYDFGAVQALVRLRPGVEPDALQAAVDAHVAAVPELGPMRELMQVRMQVRTLREQWAQGQRGSLLLGGLAVALVLAMLAINLAGLWLQRTLRRGHELSVRGALGASRGRIAAGVAAEVAVLCALAMVLALLLLAPALQALQALGVIDPAMPWQAGLDWPVAATALLLLPVLVALMAAAPALVAARSGATGLAENARALGAGARSGRGRRLLVGVQVAMAVMLLSSAGLLGRSLLQLLAEDLGFQPDGVLVLQVQDRRDDAGTAGARLRALFEQARALPGVETASFSNAAPFSGSESVSTYGDPEAPLDGISARDRVVGADWFTTVGQPLLRGRGFTAADVPVGDAAVGAASVVVDEHFARKHLGGLDVLGRQLRLPTSPGQPAQLATIVGISGNVRHQRIDETPEFGTVYRVAAQPVGHHASLLLRTPLPPEALRPALEAAAQEQGMRLEAVRRLRADVAGTLSDRLPVLQLVLGFAAAGLALSVVGLFAVMAFGVEGRRSEFGLRLAMGASPASLRRLAFAEAARIVLPGLAAGLLGATVAGRLLSTQLHGVDSADPLALAAVVLLVCACLALAAGLPAWRASRVEPTHVLRGN